jgi:predicted NodU family carbamoyl transferase
MKILGISAHDHNSAAALVIDGRRLLHRSDAARGDRDRRRRGRAGHDQ